MLIKVKNTEIKNRLYLQSYTIKELLEIFKDKYPCKECPFVMIWTGKVPEGTKDIHRMYCKFSHISLKNLPALLGLTIEDTKKEVERLKEKSDLAIDVVKIHPDNNKIFIISCILTKEINRCIIDRYLLGEIELDNKLLTMIKNWRLKYLKHP